MNAIVFPEKNHRIDRLMRDHRLAGWYAQAGANQSVILRLQDGTASSPVGVIYADDSWELQSPGRFIVLAAGKNYAWTTQGFPTPDQACAIQNRPARRKESKEAPKPKKCGWCDSTIRTQPVGMRAEDGKVRQVWACPEHLKDAFRGNKNEGDQA